MEIAGLGARGFGIKLLHGGNVSNSATGSISSSLYITGAAGTLINAGNITSTGTHSGVDLFMGGYASNAATGVISASNGVGLDISRASGTVLNSGLIETTGGHARSS